jgi:hypothetical protein
MEPAVSLFCDVCRLPHPTKDCPLIKGSIRVEDTHLPPKAIMTLPDTLTSRQDLAGGTYEIIAKQTLCRGTQFGSDK